MAASSISLPEQVKGFSTDIPPLSGRPSISSIDKTASSIAGVLATSMPPTGAEGYNQPESQLPSWGHQTIRSNNSNVGSQLEGVHPKKKKKRPGFLRFFTMKEPSAKAFTEYQDSMIRQQRNKGRPIATGLAMVSTAKLPADVPAVNSKWSGIPEAKKQPKPSSTSSRASSVISRSSSRASHASRGLQSSSASTFSFNTFGRLGSESQSSRPRESRASSLWSPAPPSPLAPSNKSLPALSPGPGSVHSLAIDSPLETLNEFISPVAVSTETPTVDHDLYALKPAAPQLLPSSQSVQLKDQISPPVISSNGLKAQASCPSLRLTKPRSKSPFNPSRNKHHAPDEDIPIPIPPIMFDTSVSASATPSRSGDRNGNPRTLLRRSGTGASQLSSKSRSRTRPMSAHSGPDMPARRTHNQQKALEKVAPWEEPGFELPPTPTASTERRKSRARSLFNA